MEQNKIWEYYQNNDDTDDAFVNARPRYAFISKQISKSSDVLNIGVGRGGLESILVDKDVNIHCLDPSEESINRIRNEFGIGERAKVGFSQAIPFPDATFDVVVMSEVLEHLSDEVLESTLREVGRVLKPGGRFIGTVPANEDLKASEVICPQCGLKFHRWGHVHSFSVDSLKELLSSHGFGFERMEVRAFPEWRRRGVKSFVKNIIKYVLGRFGSPISFPCIFFVVSRKR
ncbi:MAG: class I SAM-dependent methyltransferase [Gammaproteobacteria bacterium]|jgi:SAM-dependent methyltransferase